jgi:hypothetical protein
MALGTGGAPRFDGGWHSFLSVEVDEMKRVLFVLFGFMAVMTAIGLLVAFTRPIKWPAGIAAPDWRKAVGEAVDRTVEVEVAA